MSTEIPDREHPIGEPRTVNIPGVIGHVIPLPRDTDEQHSPAGPGTALARDEGIEGELLTEEENRALDRRLAAPRGLVEHAARVVRVVRTSERPARVGKGVVRHALTVYLGAESWAKRAWDAGTMGVYRRQVKSAEAAGNQELLAEWTERKEAAVDRRHRRLMELPGLAVGVGKAALIGLAAMLVSVLVIALLAQLSGQGSFLGVLRGVLDGVAWLFAAVVLLWTSFLIAAPFLLVLGAWREGMRRQSAPRWLQRWTGDGPAGGIIVTADGIVQALQHLGIPKLATAFKDGWMPTFGTSPIRDGNGYRAVFDLPLGVTPDMLADKRPILARNLHRAEVEVWPSDSGKASGGRAGFVDLWVADSGVLSKPAPEYPLLHAGTADVFTGVPAGVSQRGDLVVLPLVEANFVCGGMMGQGKSNACRVVLLGAALDPLAELWVHVFAGNGDFDAYRPRLARYQRGATDEVAAAGLESLRDLYAEVGQREVRLAELGAKKVTRDLATRYPELRPKVSLYSECHELFGHRDYGEEAAEYAVQTIRRGRKTGIILGFDTQSSRKDAIPPKIVELVRINACFAVKTWRSNDGFLGDGSFAAGVRATELRPGKDRGTSLVTGLGDEAFEILKWFFVEVNDDTGWDAATDVIARALHAVAPGVPTGAPNPAPQIEDTRNLLDDLATVLGDAPVPSADVPALLRELAPRWAPYRQMTGTALRDLLDRDHGIKVPSTRNKYPINPVTIRDTRVRREAAEPDQED